MADPSKILARVRACGANILLDGMRLEIVNPSRLPEGASAFIRQNAKAIAAFLDSEAEFEERAAIMQFDGGLTRPAAEYLTKLLLSSPPAGADRADWSWFVSEAAKAIDHAIPRRAA
ncbi:hypothetical protein EET67_24795 [Pseudaminobacter arsenicus]|uniref:TubC N-terminal docking domain-containing protein n=1 Tax=Borborobacter arsenicus TaxID=1851146 RepID=A0A432UZ54_9HYPH|nr:hypothetical protein [Pseudaminobacter arsenicus]RUM95171.1 hypothetical protein EET67_24795 [Pseudaminobacter arsenicus]